jgi:putative Mg2+ transporter-C (MgtC) family protein
MEPLINLEMMGRLLLASVLGALIGFEREIHGRPAGFRTHLLVSLGSCLFVIVSIDFYRMYGNFSGTGPVGVDPGRIAAQVVTGIGFLGAGAIIREKASIRGLTTAACLWVAAAIGLSCGAGKFDAAIVVAFLAVFSLLLLKKVENRISKDTYIAVKIWSSDLDGQQAVMERCIEECQAEVVDVSVEKNLEKGDIALDFYLKYKTNVAMGVLLNRISEIQGVKRVRMG